MSLASNTRGILSTVSAGLNQSYAYPTRDQGAKGYWGTTVSDAEARRLVMQGERSEHGRRVSVRPVNWYMIRSTGPMKFRLYFRRPTPAYVANIKSNVPYRNRRAPDDELQTIDYKYVPPNDAFPRGNLYSYKTATWSSDTTPGIDQWSARRWTSGVWRGGTITNGTPIDPIALISLDAWSCEPLPFINRVGTVSGYNANMRNTEAYRPPPKRRPVHRTSSARPAHRSPEREIPVDLRGRPFIR